MKQWRKCCAWGVVLSLLGGATGCTMAEDIKNEQVETIQTEDTYVNKLFDNSYVHTIDVQLSEEDLADLLANAMDETWYSCDLVIDGESFNNVGIRTKGNSSLREVANSDSNKYSFKINFGKYEEEQTYNGLDKMATNNIIQDATFMKDYLAYTLMGEFGVASPCVSYSYITINGQDWGIYLNVEDVDESFLERNYGKEYGNLYKPETEEVVPEADQMPPMGEGVERGQMPPRREGIEKDNVESLGADLKYTDDAFESYANIFDNAETKITDEDKTELIAKLKQLSEGENLEEVLDIEALSRYFVAHNFLLNDDSYTGTMLHNYYLYEQDGKLTFLPWDYNLSFGGFSKGKQKTATELVNMPIDTPLAGTTEEERPIWGQLINNDTYKEQYHELFSAFVSNFIESGTIEKEINRVAEMITPYIKRDTAAFYSYDEFVKATDTLKTFISLRGQSIRKQLNGEISSTIEGQQAAPETLIDASYINVSDMGSAQSSHRR